MSQGKPLHCVFLMNDDFTPMEFVVHVLERFFDMDPETAKRTMLRIHNEGAGECGFYPRQEAEQKVAEVVAFAERHGHPLQCAYETSRNIRIGRLSGVAVSYQAKPGDVTHWPKNRPDGIRLRCLLVGGKADMPWAHRNDSK